MKRSSNFVSYLRQLCSVGLDGRIVMPDILAVLQRLIPSSGAACFWLDDDGRPGDFQVSTLDLTQRCILATHWRDFPLGPLSLGHCGGVAVDWLGAAGAVDSRSGMAQYLLAPGRFAHVLDAWITLPNLSNAVSNAVPNVPNALNEKSGGDARLLLLLLRQPGERDFTAREKHLLAELARSMLTLGHAPPEHGVSRMPHVNGLAKKSGTIILRDGVPLWMDHVADDLLQRRLRVVPDGTWLHVSPLASACLSQARMLDGSGTSECPAESRIVLPGGHCLLHGSLLSACAGSRGRAVAIVLRWSEAPALGVLRQLRDTALSPTQREIALRLALGYRRNDIRAALEIGAETMKTHLRHIRSRLPQLREREPDTQRHAADSGPAALSRVG